MLPYMVYIYGVLAGGRYKCAKMYSYIFSKMCYDIETLYFKLKQLVMNAAYVCFSMVDDMQYLLSALHGAVLVIGFV